MIPSNLLVSSFGDSLNDWFTFCEQKQGFDAKILRKLFNDYFLNNVTIQKADTKKTKATHKDISSSESSESEDCDMMAIRNEIQTKKLPRKISGLPRDKQTPLNGVDLNKKKIPELKDLCKERNLVHTGLKKLTIIDNIQNYEKRQNELENNGESPGEIIPINIKKPKSYDKKVCEPADKPKYEVIKRHGVSMVQCSELDGYFILRPDDCVIVGWVNSDTETNTDADDSLDIRALDREKCHIAKKLNINYEAPENLDDL